MKNKQKEMVLSLGVGLGVLGLWAFIGILQQTYICFNPHEDPDIRQEEDTYEEEVVVETTPLLPL